jgi:hypothetical protein
MTTRGSLIQPQPHLIRRFESISLIQRPAEPGSMQRNHLDPTPSRILHRRLQKPISQPMSAKLRLHIEVQQICSQRSRIHPMRRKIHQPHPRTGHHAPIFRDQPTNIAPILQLWPHPRNKALNHRMHPRIIRLPHLQKHLAPLLCNQCGIRHRSKPRLEHRSIIKSVEPH